MQSTAKGTDFKTRKDTIKKKRLRKKIFFTVCIACLIVFASIMVKSKYSGDIQKNSMLGDKNKTEISKTDSAKKAENVDAKEVNKPEATAPVKNEANNSVSAENALVKDGKKTVFLTFDDGPSTTVTPKILDTLKEHKVNATFFVLGSSIDAKAESKDILKRTLEEGHAIGNHSYSHSLKKLYPHNKLDVDGFMEEVDKTNNSLKNALGQDFTARVIRMPGGYMSRKYYNDPNLGAFDAKLKEKNMCSIDWNAYDADAEGRKKYADQLVEEVKKSVGKQEKVVVLMHDTYGKEETAKALPQIIEFFKSEGYEFKTLK